VVGNKSFERVEQFRYLGKTLTNQNFVREEIKGRLKPENERCRSGQKYLSSSLLSKNMKIKIYKNIMWPVLYGCEAWFIILREEHRLMVFENRALRKIIRLMAVEVTGEWRRLQNEELFALCSSPNVIRVIK
jgi:hypothetical protein